MHRTEGMTGTGGPTAGGMTGTTTVGTGGTTGTTSGGMTTGGADTESVGMTGHFMEGVML